MAQNEYIQLLDDSWRKEIEDAKKELGTLAAVIVKINDDLKGIETKMGNATKLAEIAKLTKGLEDKQQALNKALEDAVKAREKYDAKVAAAKKQVDDLTRAQDRLTKAQSAEAVEVAKVTLAISEQNAQNKAAANLATAKEGSLIALRAELKQLTLAYDALSAEERENLQVGVAMQKQISDITAKLNAAEQATGRFGRNVGNYAGAVSGFKMQFQQVARELPSLANGLQTFFMAIGNNVPMAIDALKQLKEQQAAARAEGQKTVPVWRTVIGSIFSWQMALLALLTVLPMLPKLLKGNKDAADEAEKAQKRYTESLKQTEQSARSNASAEIAHMQTLTQSAANAELSMKVRLRAVKELQESYPSYFGNLTKEAILAGNVADEMNRATKAIIAKSMATAAEKKLAITGERYLDIRDEIIKANEDVRKANDRFQVESARANNGYVAAANETNALTAARFAKDLENKKEYRDNLIKQADELLKAQKGYANAFNVYSSEAGNMMIEGSDLKKDPKPKKTKETKEYSPKDYTQELAAERAKQIEIEAEALLRIVNDEKQALLTRINALREYEQKRMDAVAMATDGEIAETQNKLRRIARIEATEYSKRSGADKDLLLQKGLLEARITRLTAEAANERAKIRTDAANTETKIIEKFYKEYTNAAKIAEQYIAEFKAGARNGKAANRAEREDLNERLQLLRTYQQAANELASISSIQTQQRLSELDAESRAIERKYQKEIDGVERSLLSEQEKSAKIADLREKAYQEEQVIEGKRKAEKIKQAQFEKELAIANIIINTAAAVVRAAMMGNYAEAIATGILGAAQLAVAIATPIPQYAKGTEHHPADGPAIVGDGGRSEYVINPDGTISRTPSTPTLVHLRKGAKVIPSAEEFMRRYANDYRSLRVIPMAGDKIDLSELKNEMRTQTKALSAAFARQRPFSLRLERDSYRQRRSFRP